MAINKTFDNTNTASSSDDDYTFPIEKVLSYQDKYYINFFLATCTNFYGGYLIIRKSPKEMATYRWFLLNILLIAYVLDFYLTVLYQPYFLFPVPSICSIGGLLQYLNPPMLALAGGGFVFIELAGVLAISILFAQFYRLAAVYGFHQRLTKPKHLSAIILLHVIYAAPALVIFSFGIHENRFQEDLHNEAYKNYPGIRDILDVYTCVFTPPDRTFVRASLISQIVMIVLTSLIGFTMIVVGFISLSMKRRSMSEKTYNMHLRLNLSLVVQILLPLLTVCLPLSFTAISFLYQLPYLKAISQAYGTLLSSHSCLNALVMITLTGPYRRATVDYVCSLNKCHHRHRQNQVSSIATGSQQTKIRITRTRIFATNSILPN